MDVRRSRSAFLPALALALSGLIVAPAHAAPASPAEVTANHYARAEAILPQNIDKLVLQTSVRPRWIGEGSRFWFEKETAEGYEYLLVDPAAGTTTPLVDRAGLLGALAAITGEAHDQRTMRLQDLELDKDERTLRFRLGGRSWVYDTGTGQLSEKRADSSIEPGTESPDGKWRAVSRGGDLYVVPTAGGREIRLTTDGSLQHPYARSVVNVKTMIAKETSTPALAPHVAWSPDSKRIATYRIDDSKARRLSLVQSTPPGGAMPRSFDYVYTLTGDATPPTAKGMIFDIAAGTRTEMAMPAQPILYYGGLYFEWAGDNSAVFLAVPGRGYKTYQLRRIDAGTGAMTVLHEDRSDTYIDYYGHSWYPEPKWNTHFWTADPTGWAHVYSIDGSTGERRQLTSGEWRARSVAGTDKEGRALLVVGSGREKGIDPYLRSLYRVRLRGGAPLLLTPEPLDHDVSVSPDGKFFVDNMSLINQPTRSVLRRTSNGAIVMELAQADISAFTRAGYTLPEPFETVAADGKTPIYGAIWRPSSFDPKKSYPVVENIYTGPHYVMTPKSFEAALKGRNAGSVAELGFIAVTIDGRGTWGRSRAFQQPAYKNLHNVGLDDHVAGITAMAAEYPYMDLGRVGIYGFSAGGYDVVRAMTRRPDFYKVGVSASGNHDNRLDKAVWNEQWMGPELGPLYDENSNVTWADKLAGRLFLAHGELDENVPPAATLRLAEALIRANKDFEFLIVPNADHFLDESPYFQRLRWDYFVRHLHGVEPPRDYTVKPFD